MGRGSRRPPVAAAERASTPAHRAEAYCYPRADDAAPATVFFMSLKRLAGGLHVHVRADDDDDGGEKPDPEPDRAIRARVAVEHADQREQEEQHGEHHRDHRGRDADLELDVREPDGLPDQQDDRDQSGHDTDPVPHGHAGIDVDEVAGGAEIDFVPVEERDDEEHDRGDEDDLCASRKPIHHVHCAAVSFRSTPGSVSHSGPCRNTYVPRAGTPATWHHRLTRSTANFHVAPDVVDPRRARPHTSGIA